MSQDQRLKFGLMPLLRRLTLEGSGYLTVVLLVDTGLIERGVEGLSAKAQPRPQFEACRCGVA